MLDQVLAAMIEVQSGTWFRTNRSFICGPFVEIVQTLNNEEFGEKPVWIGRGEGVNTVLLVNPDRTSWTVVMYQNEVGCVVGAGSASQVFDPAFERPKK